MTDETRDAITHDNERLYTTAEAALALEMHRGSVKKAIRQGRLGPVFHIGDARIILIPQSAIDRYLATPRNPGRGKKRNQ